MQKLARKNLERLGLEDRVVLKLKDIAEGFEERGVDALFLESIIELLISLAEAAEVDVELINFRIVDFLSNEVGELQ